MAADLRAWTVDDRDAWNSFVERAPYHAFPQLWEWGELRSAGGWRPIRLAVGETGEQPLAGVQLLLRPVPVIGWALAYAPRGPIGALDERRVRESLIDALRALGRRARIATVRADPEAALDTPYGRSLLEPPWRAASKVQPPVTRLIDLSVSEDELRSDLKRKHRQYVNKAERAGVEIERFDASSDPEETRRAVGDFNRIYADTAARAGFVARAAHYYQRVWSVFAPSRRCRLAFATQNGVRVATIFHFTCGERVVEAYGGMTDAGAESRANYLLKWSSIVDFARAGFKVYDMWGLATGGIRHFKEGFGGREVEYVGARDLALRGAADAIIRVAIPAYGLAQRAKLRVTRAGSGGAAGPADV